MKNRKKTITLAAALLLTVAASAQVFILTEEDNENNKRKKPASGDPFVPYQGGDLDQIMLSPLGSGWLLLASMGGAYLLGKRKKDNEK